MFEIKLLYLKYDRYVHNMRDTWPGHDLVFNLGLLSKVSKSFARFLDAAEVRISKLKYIKIYLSVSKHFY